MKRSLLMPLAVGILLSGCGNPFSGAPHSSVDAGFRPGVPAAGDAGAAPQGPQASVGDKSGFKVGPGAVRAAGSNVAAVAAITNDRTRLSGLQVLGRFALSRKVMR